MFFYRGFDNKTSAKYVTLEGETDRKIQNGSSQYFFGSPWCIQTLIYQSIDRVAKISTDLKSTLNSRLERSIFGILISL